MPEDVNIGELHSFVLENLSKVPNARRVVLLRALAAVVGDAHVATKLRKEASELEVIEQQHQHLVTYFQNKGSKP